MNYDTKVTIVDWVSPEREELRRHISYYFGWVGNIKDFYDITKSIDEYGDSDLSNVFLSDLYKVVDACELSGCLSDIKQYFRESIPNTVFSDAVYKELLVLLFNKVESLFTYIAENVGSYVRDYITVLSELRYFAYLLHGEIFTDRYSYDNALTEYYKAVTGKPTSNIKIFLSGSRTLEYRNRLEALMKKYDSLYQSVQDVIDIDEFYFDKGYVSELICLSIKQLSHLSKCFEEGYYSYFYSLGLSAKLYVDNTLYIIKVIDNLK